MAHSDVVKILKDVTVVISDLADAHTFTPSHQPGDFSITFGGAEIIKIYDRDSRDQTRIGKPVDPSATFSINATDVSDAAYATLVDICLWTQSNTNASYVYSNWVSRYGASHPTKAVKLVFTIAGVSNGDASDHTITMDKCTMTCNMATGNPSTVSINIDSFADIDVA